jgi:hypothetical protein
MLPALCRGQLTTGSRIARTFVPVWRAGDACNLRTRTVTGIYQIGIDQTLQMEGVDLLSLALHIGSIWPTSIWTLIPIQSQPAQIIEHTLCGSWSYTRSIQVFDTHHKLSTSTASKEPGQQSRTQVAQMQITRRTGGVSTAHHCE